jgi:hypothetical protein
MPETMQRMPLIGEPAPAFRAEDHAGPDLLPRTITKASG